jgi:hypothetical protein
MTVTQEKPQIGIWDGNWYLVLDNWYLGTSERELRTMERAQIPQGASTQAKYQVSNTNHRSLSRIALIFAPRS